MRLSSLAIISTTFGLAAGLSLIGAGFAVKAIEDGSELGVRRALDDRGLHWAEVHADGLQVFLTGTAPTEAIRFNALSAAGGVVDAARVIDKMTVRDSAKLQAPRFSIEILRNDGGISLIGLVPASTDRAELMAKIRPLAANGKVTDLLETADYPVPDAWDDTLDYAIRALKSLPRSKVSVAAGAVEIRAMSNSADDKRKLEADLNRTAPDDLDLTLNISAPRPVITPFTLRFLIDENGPRFDACSAEDEDARTRIIAAAEKAGMTGKPNCVIGLGVPSPNWADAVETALTALTELGQGSVTFSDADVTLVAAEGTAQGQFDRVVGELENALPDVFALHSVLPKPEKKDAATDVPEFTATLSPEGLVQLRGRLTDELTRTAAETFAKARFGTAVIHTAARLDDSLPDSWGLRVLTALDGLSRLSNGYVMVTPALITLSGKTGNPDASAEIARLFANQLGEKERFDLSVDYVEALDPVASIPTPEECEARIGEILKTRKINFEPGSDKPDQEAAAILDDIAEILKQCGEIRMEVGGHTDSQGREEMNQALSQRRAQAVLNALRERKVLTSSFTAKGFGEEQPIADNETEEGRDANRRIEFKLIRPEPTPEPETTLESIAQSAQEAATEQAIDPADAAAEGGSNDE
ncbi:OmpA-OmpF porin, OOP family [Thalassovita litoralis]|uniref:OmpA-OmpF porin, OOP family n=1 Tax=Thalassovita litoralis TaxID=1010611 RepID=A0A521CUB2_9RHOB|nr:OmpA family protein [Thalassovita litoralis]SMO62250.1 OmpA-OmpF porin, OOP family [Thalassovita litoralis]